MNDTLMDQCRREAEDRYPITVVKEPGGGEYFFVQCKCSFVFLSRDADGCHPIADSGDHSEMRCPSCGIIAEDECYDTNVINAARATYAAALYAERSKRPPTVQQTIDAAVEVFGLGPEDQDDVLRFGMKLQDMPHTGLTVEEVMEVVGPLCIGDATSLRIAQALTEKLNQTNG